MTGLASAACRHEDPHLFFPDKDWGPGKAICAACEVRAECLADALASEAESNRHGLRGGMTPNERTVYVRKQARDARLRQSLIRHGTDSCYARGCRRPECRDAHTNYERRRRAERQAS